jgi:RHS repeat-associated protein
VPGSRGRPRGKQSGKGIPAARYTFDQNGNELAAGARTFSYDLANRIVSTASSSTATTYRYDGDGARLEASTGASPAQKTSYLWDPNEPLPELAVERDGSGTLLRRYLYGLSRISMTTPGGTFYYHYDGVGSVTNLTTSSGKTEWTDLYEPFGAVRTETKNDAAAPANPMKFAGEYLDAIGLYNLRAREYDPVVGRFLAQDPAPGAEDEPYLGSYVYVGDRPTVLVDPSGKWGQPPSWVGDAALAASTGAALGATTPCARAEALRQRVITYAQRFLGVPYLWGGTTPHGFDCSGLVQYVYEHAANIDLPRTTWYQRYEGVEAVRSSLRPGDLVFFNADDHVGIYLGNGKFIHAPHTGDFVKISDLSSGHYAFVFNRARRIILCSGVSQ